MSRIHVCSLAKIEDTVRETGARSLITLINADTPVTRPAIIAAERHLLLSMSDIVEPIEGHLPPHSAHVDTLLSFVRHWDRREPLLIHCFAGVSRSTAAAFITACALRPERDESELAQLIRTRSPTATPNALLVSLADQALSRGGRMSQAVSAIGMGEMCYEGVPFMLEID
ncbi:MAG: protein tyrosine phosphatase [Rhizobiales bacterium 62-17]|nr:protein tyrosine phosphatase [Hyphomicrobiales bacterium]OJY00546.1 MAG: protein tyrosine phosphatase [Rhizobiales bacterium 62-17]